MRSPAHFSVLMDIRVEGRLHRILQARLHRQSGRSDRILSLSIWGTDLPSKYLRHRHLWFLLVPTLTPFSL